MVHLQTYQNEDLDKKVIQELEAWERLRTAPLKLQKDFKEQGSRNMRESIQISKPEGLKWGVSINRRESQKVSKNLRETQKGVSVNRRESQTNMRESQMNMGESQAMSRSLTKKGLTKKQERSAILFNLKGK